MKKRVLSIILAICMVIVVGATFGFPTTANMANEPLIEASLGSDGTAYFYTDRSMQGIYYAVLGKDGVVVPASTSGTTTPAANNGWYQATSANGVSFMGLDPTQMPFQIVFSGAPDIAPAGTSTAVTNGTATGNQIYYYYIANDNTAEGYTTAGNDNSGDGTMLKPFKTTQHAAAKIGSIEEKHQGVIVLLDNTYLTRLLQFPDIQDPMHPEEGDDESQYITVTSYGGTHSMIRTYRDNTAFELCNVSRAVLDNVIVDGQRKVNDYGEVYLDRNTVFTMRGNSKIINGGNRGVEIRAGATFIMESGEISGNTAGVNPWHWSDGYEPPKIKAGGGVYICSSDLYSGVFIMKGGTITGNKAEDGAAGVYGEKGSIMKISGDAVVTGNTQNDAPSNIYLNNNQNIKLSQALSENANLGVYVTNMPGEGDPDVMVAEGENGYVPTLSDMKAFSSDQATTAGIMLKNNQILMSNEAKNLEVSIVGKVSDYPGGQTTLSDLPIYIYDADDTDFATPLRSTGTDADGKYTFHMMLKKGNYVIRTFEKENVYDESTTAVTVDKDGEINTSLTLRKYTKAEETAINGTNGWYKDENSDITLTAPTGYEISTSNTGGWTNSIILDKTDGMNKSATYYLKQISDNRISSKRTFNYNVDNSIPEGRVAFDSGAVTNATRNITSRLFLNKDINVTIASSDAVSGVEKVEIYKSDKALTQKQLEAVNWTEYTESIKKKAKDKEKLIYYARITDKAGNITIVNSQNVEFDLTAPTIKGVKKGEVYYTSQIVKAFDDNDATLTVNGQGFESGGKIAGNQNITYEIVATDKAGNTTTESVTMKPIADISKSLNNINEDNVTKDDQKKIVEVKKNAELVDTTFATDEEKKELQKIIDKCDLLLKRLVKESNVIRIILTGDSSQTPRWISILLISGGALIVLLVDNKRRKAINK